MDEDLKARVVLLESQVAMLMAEVGHLRGALANQKLRPGGEDVSGPGNTAS